MGNDKNDLTRIEDLSEFLHPEDLEAEAALSEENEEVASIHEEIPPTPDLENELDSESNFQQDENLNFGEEDNSANYLDENNDDNISEESESLDFSDEDNFAEDSFTEQEESEDSFESDSNEPDENNDDEVGGDLNFSMPEAEFQDEEIQEEADFSEEEVQNFEEGEPVVIEDEQEFDLKEENDIQNENIVENEEDNNLQAIKEDIVNEALLEKEKSNSNSEADSILSFGNNDIQTDENELEEVILPSENRGHDRENFQEVRNFGNNLTYGVISNHANPPYSILIENIKNFNDGEYFISVLKEHGLVDDQNEEDFKTSLDYGRLLISQISEYSAIYLAHKFRSYDIKLKMGPSDAIHSSVNYDDDGQGKVSYQNINQNTFQEKSLEAQASSHIVLSTSLTLENYFIEEYLDILTVEKII